MILTPGEILDMNGGLLPDSVREKLKPLAEAVINGTFSGVEDRLLSEPKKYCSMVLEGKAFVACYSQTYMPDGRISTDLTIVSPYQ
jgi:hypothetical protein